MPEEEAPQPEVSPEELNARLSNVERLLGLQRMVAENTMTTEELAGGSHQSVNCGSHRSCASLICAAPGDEILQ